MPSTGKLLLASFGAAWASKVPVLTTVPVPEWVLGAIGKSCTETCEGQTPKLKCRDDRVYPSAKAEFEFIRSTIRDPKTLAVCSAYVDTKDDNGPAISKGVCWYSSTATTFKCGANDDDKMPVCRCTGTEVAERNPIPDPIKYPAVFKEVVDASMNITIKFPFLSKDAFECLGGGVWGAQTVRKVPGVKPNEIFFNMADAIKQALGMRAMAIEFVAPKKYDDPLEARVGVYTKRKLLTPLTWRKVGDIGPKLVKDHPELKLCSYPGKAETWKTEYGQAPTFDISQTPTGNWRPARMDEISTDSVVLALGVDMRSLGVASAGVLLVAGVVVLWRRRKEDESVSAELVPSLCE